LSNSVSEDTLLKVETPIHNTSTKSISSSFWQKKFSHRIFEKTQIKA
jgi:hypothetical protein